MKRHAMTVALLCSTAAIAGPADYVYLPGVEYGEREFDFKLGAATPPGAAAQRAASLGFGYGASEVWFTEIYLKYEREGGTGTRFDAIEWENKFQLTETGKYPVDLGFIVEFEAPRQRSEGYELRFGPLLQAESGALQFNANLLLERVLRNTDSLAHVTELGYQWQAKYRLRPAFEFGLQGFGEVGKWNDWDNREEQNHRLGPALFGKLPLGNHQALRYNAAWLFGASSAAPDHTLRAQVEFEY